MRTQLFTRAHIALGLIAATLLLPSLATAKHLDAAQSAVKVAFTQNFGAEYAVTVESGNDRYRFITIIAESDNPSVGLEQQKRLTGWKGHFLFARQQCANPAQWRCVVDQVFTLQNNALVHLGNIESGPCTELGCRYDEKSGVFADLYDGLQVNPATGAVDAPPVILSRIVKGNKLVTDLERTAEANAVQLTQSRACLDHLVKVGFEPGCENKLNPWTSLVFTYKLNQYLGRAKERDAVLANEGKVYCQKSADARCQQRVTGLQENFSLIPVGEAPRYSPGRVELTAASAVKTEARVEAFGPAKAIPLGKPIPLGK